MGLAVLLSDDILVHDAILQVLSADMLQYIL
jgi:hypothetical protein